jgi:hypothetical protein
MQVLDYKFALAFNTLRKRWLLCLSSPPLFAGESERGKQAVIHEQPARRLFENGIIDGTRSTSGLGTPKKSWLSSFHSLPPSGTLPRRKQAVKTFSTAR